MTHLLIVSHSGRQAFGNFNDWVVQEKMQVLYLLSHWNAGDPVVRRNW